MCSTSEIVGRADFSWGDLREECGLVGCTDLKWSRVLCLRFFVGTANIDSHDFFCLGYGLCFLAEQAAKVVEFITGAVTKTESIQTQSVSFIECLSVHDDGVLCHHNC